jgi:hypothetical protein
MQMQTRQDAIKCKVEYTYAINNKVQFELHANSTVVQRNAYNSAKCNCKQYKMLLNAKWSTLMQEITKCSLKYMQIVKLCNEYMHV